jgi:hypothetical protein
MDTRLADAARNTFHEDKQRLAVLDDAIDNLERPDEAAVIQAPDARHHHNRKGKQKACDE